MEHTEAMKSNAAERYLLGELTETEAESFEDHFFECRICGEEIREGTRVFEALGEVVREVRPAAGVIAPFPAPAPVPPPSRRWLQLAVAAILTIGISVPILKTLVDKQVPQTVQGKVTVLNIGGAARGPEDKAEVRKGYENLMLNVDVASTTPFPRYAITVRDAHKKSWATKSVAAADTESAVPLLLLGELPAGSYEVLIEGVREDGKRTTINTQSFQVKP